MPRSDRRPIDWRGWLALAWAAWFALLYGTMLLERRAPGELARLRRGPAAAVVRAGHP